MNPYEVLGVSPNDDEETIKKAYRELVKKYHPDKYVNSPMAEVAGEKMKEINRAYDMITKGGAEKAESSGNTGNKGGYYGYNPFGQSPFGQNPFGGGYSAQPSFQNVRMLINQGQLVMASRMLSALPRTAEWYYLNGLIAMRRGWYQQAFENIQAACNMDPNNTEYRSVLENLRSRNTEYTHSGYGTSNGGCCTDCCTAMLCWNCCATPCC